MNRREFCAGISAAFLLHACGKAVEAVPADIEKKTILRFTVASDWHYGEPNTNYNLFFDEFKSAFSAFSQSSPSDFIVLNGDIIHNDPVLLQPAATKLKTLHPKLYVTQGNHDRVNEAAWTAAWGMPLNHDFTLNNQAFLLGTTATEKGMFQCPDMNWFTQKLEQYKGMDNIFIFLHITPVKWTSGAQDCSDFQELIKKYPNVRAVFNGHDHEQDSIKLLGNVPFMFDGHIGGSWGTYYRGFRVVELKDDNTVITYMMDPAKKINTTTFKKNMV